MGVLLPMDDSFPTLSKVSTSHKTTKPPLLRVVLVEPEIPANTGSIARLCAASNCQLILLGTLGFELSNTRLKRAGLDYWRFVRWQHHPQDPLNFLKTLPSRSVHLFSRHSTTPYTHCPATTGDWLVFGKESEGLSKPILQRFPNQCYGISHHQPQVRSLNLATVVGITVHEVLRRFSVN